MIPAALVEIKPLDHGRVTRHLLEHGGEPAERVVTQGLVLLPHGEGVLHLLVARGEVAVPEEGCLFPQRIRGVAHPVEPPDTEGEDFLAVSTSEVLSEDLTLLLVSRLLDPLIVGKSHLRIHQGWRWK